MYFLISLKFLPVEGNALSCLSKKSQVRPLFSYLIIDFKSDDQWDYGNGKGERGGLSHGAPPRRLKMAVDPVTCVTLLAVTFKTNN